jgi:quercetin dioxygenase-like cupin family protein
MSRPHSEKAWPWPDSLDALAAAPQYHHLLLENENVRVLNVVIGPGQLVPVHTHRWPSVVYTIGAVDFVRRDGDGNILLDTRTLPHDAQPPPVAWIPPLPPHSVENVGQSEIRLFTVELKVGLH